MAVCAGCSLIDVERVLSPAELVPWVTSLAAGALVSYAGDAIDAHAEVFADLRDTWLAPRTPSGASVAFLAARTPDILTSGAPTYIRPSEAEV